MEAGRSLDEGVAPDKGHALVRWAERVQSSPTYACAVLTLKAAASHRKQQPRLVMEAIKQHAAKLSLRWASVTDEGVLVEPLAGADQRIIRIARAAAREQEHAPEVRCRHRCVFRADIGHGQHVCRLVAKVSCLSHLSLQRHDVEGAGEVHVEVLSVPTWKKWRDSLCREDRHALMHWRAGAVSAPSRQQGHPDRPTACPHCKKEVASARPLWAQCEFFSESRRKLEAVYGISSS